MVQTNNRLFKCILDYTEKQISQMLNKPGFTVCIVPYWFWTLRTWAENEASPCTCTQRTLSSVGSGLYSPHWYSCCLARALPTATGLLALTEIKHGKRVQHTKNWHWVGYKVRLLTHFKDYRKLGLFVYQ